MTASLCFASEVFTVDHNIKKVDGYFLLDSETLSYEAIITVSKSIIESREKYPTETLGKTFILLASIANNKGEDADAFQFAQDGLSIRGLSNSMKYNLLLKVANGYYLKEKYIQTQNVATSVIVMAESSDVLKYRLIALSYRAVAYALQNKNNLSLDDLKEVEQLISTHPKYGDHLPLLEILATAHYYLGDYQTSLTMENKLLTLRFDLNRVANIDQTYLNLARAYLQLGLFDDAYNAYWEAQKHSAEKNAPIRVAYAELGLAEVLLRQRKYQDAHNWLLTANDTFNEKSLSKPYLTTLILLAETALKLGEKDEYKNYLHQGELIYKNTKLSKNQSKLLLLLSDMYQEKGDYQNALAMHKNYLEHFQQFQQKINFSISANNNEGLNAKEKSKDLIFDLTEQSKLKKQYDATDVAQKQKIFILTVVIIVLLVTFVFWLLRQRTLRLNQVYDEVDQPLFFLANPTQTKKIYQLNYKMARKFGYPLAVGYLSVTNWQELSFHFNSKIMMEVSKTLATLLNEAKGEFDEAGEISGGEYLLLSPYQTEDEIADKLDHLAKAIKVRFFANLGEYSVKIGYAYDLPTAQDIDPYIFLSRLSETTKV
jgi:tetratricopeptide (TPR) repeat protein/GGDEF domain-containing protein